MAELLDRYEAGNLAIYYDYASYYYTDDDLPEELQNARFHHPFHPNDGWKYRRHS